MKLAPDVADYLAGFDPRLLATSEGRRILTRLEPRLFALVYLRHHLHGEETDETVSFSEAHLDWYDQILEWVRPIPEPRSWRRAYVAPRNSAKTTVWFLIAPLWAAAHGHAEFVAAFADSASQAEGHLTTFKRELDTNALLRADYPDLCRPLVRQWRGTTVADNRSLIQQKSGFVFAAKGIDSATLGLKVGEKRPDVIILDDIEPDAANYSAYLATKRLSTLQNAILPLNEWARVVLVGTVTMDGSLVHQLVKSVTSIGEPEPWIDDESFECHYWPALVEEDDGTHRSLWPEKWPLDYLYSIRHTRSFALNFQNLPVAVDGDYWSPDDITHEPLPDDGAPLRTILSVDPAVTTKQTSDYTGLAVLTHSPIKQLGAGKKLGTGKVYVRHCRRVRLDPKRLRSLVVDILNEYPEIRVIFVEINQGGDLWEHVFEDLPVKYVTKHQTVRKEVRAGWLLDGYQSREVVHVEPLPELEAELLAFPGLYDDQVDAVGSGYGWLTGAGQSRKPKRRAGVRTGSYV